MKQIQDINHHKQQWFWKTLIDGTEINFKTNTQGLGVYYQHGNAETWETLYSPYRELPVNIADMWPDQRADFILNTIEKYGEYLKEKPNGFYDTHKTS